MGRAALCRLCAAGARASRSAIDLGEAQDIDKLVRDFRAALSDPKQRFFQGGGQELFEKLIGPLRSSLGESTERLLSPPTVRSICVPFAALDRRARASISPSALSSPISPAGAICCAWRRINACA